MTGEDESDCTDGVNASQRAESRSLRPHTLAIIISITVVIILVAAIILCRRKCKPDNYELQMDVIAAKPLNNGTLNNGVGNHANGTF